MNELTVLSGQLLTAVKTGASPWETAMQLQEFPFESLKHQLDNDHRKTAFWVNTYNAFFLILRQLEKIEKPGIYTKKLINISGKNFSLDDIEHGILRRYRYKFSLGYLPNPFKSGMIKSLAVSKIDYRIHFALNCGAKSCPPIAFYTEDKIDNQLEMATISFLETETEIDHDKKEIHITRLFKWYLGDFGGYSGIKNILKEKLQLETKGYQLKFKPYSWEEDLGNFKEFSFLN